MQLSGVHPSAVWTERTGRGWLNTKISFRRTPKICPVTSLVASLHNATANGAILSGVIFLATSMRAAFSGVLGMVPTRRVQANGAMQFERTPNFAMSSAIHLERPATPILEAP